MWFNRQPVTTEAKFWSLAIPCGIYGGQSGIRVGLSPSTLGFPYKHRATLITRASGPLEPSDKALPFPHRKIIASKCRATFYCLVFKAQEVCKMGGQLTTVQVAGLTLYIA